YDREESPEMGLAVMVADALECGRSARCGTGSAQKLAFRDGVTGPRCFSIGGQFYALSLEGILNEKCVAVCSAYRARGGREADCHLLMIRYPTRGKCSSPHGSRVGTMFLRSVLSSMLMRCFSKSSVMIAGPVIA